LKDYFLTAALISSDRHDASLLMIGLSNDPPYKNPFIFNLQNKTSCNTTALPSMFSNQYQYVNFKLSSKPIYSQVFKDLANTSMNTHAIVMLIQHLSVSDM